MSSGRIQLAATGAQDAFLTGQPEFTYFLTVFKRHTRFTSQAQEIVFDDVNFDFGRTAEATLPRFGDLIRAVYFKFDLPSLLPNDPNGNPITDVDQGYTDSVGNAIIESVELVIGGQTIEVLTGEWMELRQDLYTPESQMDALKDIIGTTYSRQGLGKSTSDRTFIVPLPFYFYGHSELAIPHVALRYQEVSIRMKLKKAEQLIVSQQGAANIVDFYSGLKLLNPALIVDYVYLEDKEAEFFSKKQLTYPITQVQVANAKISSETSEKTQVYKLGFVNPVKELYFVIQDDSKVVTNSPNGNDWFNYFRSDGSNQLKNLQLTFNGQVRLSSAVANDLYMRVVQPLDYHTKTPTRSFYVYSFALKPEDYIPSGQVNLSRINNVGLEVTLPAENTPTQKAIRVYAHNYNILRVQSGVAGVLFNFRQN